MPKPSADQIMSAIYRYYRLVDQGDVDSVVKLFAENAIYERPGYDPMIGRDQLDKFYGSQRIIDSGQHTVVKMLVNSSYVAVEGEFAGRLKDGGTVDLRFADFFVVNDGLLIEARNTYFFSPLV